ncbi:MAG: FHA domain-containing protein [Phycisphaerae bacterium]|nr:FHA domain-containing protein [Phycisphaerae bacterium]
MQVNLVMFKDEERRDFAVQGDRTVIGRKLDCDLRIPTGDVSREHCEVLSNGSGLRVRDLESANGTYVNGKRVTESPLKAGDKLSVGPVVFVVQVDGQPARITPHDVKMPDIAAEEAPKVAAKPAAAAPAKPAAAAKPAPAAKPAGGAGKAIGGAAALGAAASAAKPAPKKQEEEFDLNEDDLFSGADEEFDMDAVEFLDDEDEESMP